MPATSTLAERWIHTVIRARLHIQACSLVAVWAWSHFLGADLDTVTLLVAPLAVASVYLWNRLTDTREDAINCPHELPRASHQNLLLRLSAVVAGSLSLILASASRLPGATALVALVLLLGLLYSGFGERQRHIIRLKDMFLIKNLSSASGWSVLTVLYPALFAQRVEKGPLVIAFASMFLSVFIVEVIWDIRDRKGDGAAGIRTIPVRLGLLAAKKTVLAATGLFCLVILLGLMNNSLSLVWLWCLINAALIFLAASSMLDYMQSNRLWSHLLVLVQTSMLLGAGLLTRP